MIAQLVHVNDDAAATALEVVAGGKLFQVRQLLHFPGVFKIGLDNPLGVGSRRSHKERSKGLDLHAWKSPAGLDSPAL